MTSLHEYSKKRAMQNYLDAEVREFAERTGLSRNETWELRVTTLATMLARTLSETESNDSEFKIEVDPVGNVWTERLSRLLSDRTRVLSQEEFLELHGE